MKTKSLFLAALLTACLPAAAQLESPPDVIDYQGRLLNSQGGPLTSSGGPGTTGTATNFEIRFRIWDQQTGGDLIWAEKQIVTVTGDGLFSVRLGEGEDIDTQDQTGPDGLTSNADEANLLNAFNNSERFLGVTVIIPDDTPGEIEPRLKFLTSPFAVIAERAIWAEKAADGETFFADTLGVGNGLSNADATFHLYGGATSSQFLLGENAMNDKSALITYFQGDGGGTTGTADGYLALTHSGDPAGTGLYVTQGGNVGIGTTNPDVNAKLDVAGSIRAHNINIESAASGPGRYNILHRDTIDALVFRDSWGGVDRMVLKNDGRLGIGTTNPEARLHIYNGDSGVATSSASSMVLEDDVTHYFQVSIPNNAQSGITFATVDHPLDGAIIYRDQGSLDSMSVRVGDTTKMVVLENGRVGIGTTTPGFPLDVQGDVGTGLISGHRWFNHNASGLNSNSADFLTSINSDWYVRAFGFLAISDRRIKKDIESPDSGEDLRKIQALQVRDYSMIDTVQAGESRCRGFIAQEVEEVMPEAVMRNTSMIPSIYQAAESLKFSDDNNTCFVSMKNPHDLSVGDRVRVIGDDGPKEVEVTSTPDESTFQFNSEGRTWNRLFVYGKEVDDFRSVDYPQLFTTTISALQEVKRQQDHEVSALKEENETLKRRLAALEARDRDLNERFTKLERVIEKVSDSPGQLVHSADAR